MRFSITFDEEVPILGRLTRDHHEGVSICPYDGEDSSRSFLEQLDRLFIEKYGESTSSYFKNTRVVCRNKCVGVMSQWTDDPHRVQLSVFGKLLSMIVETIECSELRVRVELTEMQVKYYTERARLLTKFPLFVPVFTQDVITFPSEYQIITSKEMMATYDEDLKDLYDGYSYWADLDIQIPSLWKPYLDLKERNPKVALCGKMKLEFSTCGFNCSLSPVSESCLELRNMNKAILEEAILPDAVIIGDNGKEVMCHRSFLAGRSRKLANIWNDCKEPTTCRIRMKDMSEDGINALLRYLYFGDLAAARERPQILSQLLDAGHKYEIKSLVEDISGVPSE